MIDLLFYLAAAIAVICTLMVVTRRHAVHALLYLIVAQLAVSFIFFLLGAPFAAAMQVLVYAGAIMVLFVFVVMMLNLGRTSLDQESRWLPPGIWLGPTLLSATLLTELLWILPHSGAEGAAWISAKAVGIQLFGPYLLAVELASMLLLAALVGAYHLTRHYIHPGTHREAPSEAGNKKKNPSAHTDTTSDIHHQDAEEAPS
jgi:NADH-quinone oxidoreductase subunit J